MSRQRLSKVQRGGTGDRELKYQSCTRILPCKKVAPPIAIDDLSVAHRALSLLALLILDMKGSSSVPCPVSRSNGITRNRVPNETSRAGNAAINVLESIQQLSICFSFLPSPTPHKLSSLLSFFQIRGTPHGSTGHLSIAGRGTTSCAEGNASCINDSSDCNDLFHTGHRGFLTLNREIVPSTEKHGIKKAKTCS